MEDIIDLINKKRLKEELTKEEIQLIINGFLNNTIKDYQMSALLMAICLNGMTEEETFIFTETMLYSGEQVDLSSINGTKVDKHSTGGVGDKVTLVVVPLAASCGVIVPKTSGRALDFTGGTIDKLEAIEGFNVNLDEEQLIEQLKTLGAAITTSSRDLVPADKKMYALRDVTGTVSSIPLIASSIMSKKLAMGSDKILLDVKEGKGALLPSKEEAQTLAHLMVKIGHRFNKETIAIISNMDYPLGNNIGNALEVKEAIEVLNGKGNERLKELCLVLASLMVSLGKQAKYEEAKQMVMDNINNGKAYEKFQELVKYQHGDLNKIEISNKIVPIISDKEGYVHGIDALELGDISMDLGAGRKNKEDIINHGVGIVIIKHVGSYVKVGDIIAEAYVGDKEVELNRINQAYAIALEKPIEEPLIYDIIQ